MKSNTTRPLFRIGGRIAFILILILSLTVARAQDCTAVNADGVQDTNIPAHQWKVELYQGFFGVQGALTEPGYVNSYSEHLDHVSGGGDPGAFGTPILREEAYTALAALPFAFAEETIQISENPLDFAFFDSRADIGPGFDPVVADGGWQMIITRTATAVNNITIGLPGSYIDDHVELFVDGVLVDDIIGFRPSLLPANVINYTTSPGEVIEIRLTNREGRGGFDVYIDSPSLDLDNNSIPDACQTDDFDTDGVPDSVDLDDDNDGILDTVECAGNTSVANMTGDITDSDTGNYPLSITGNGVSGGPTPGGVFLTDITLNTTLNGGDVYESCEFIIVADDFDDGFQASVDGTPVLYFDQSNWDNTLGAATTEFNNGGLFDSDASGRWTPWSGEGNPQLMLKSNGEISLMVDTKASGVRLNALAFMDSASAGWVLNNSFSFSCLTGANIIFGNANDNGVGGIGQITNTVVTANIYVCPDEDGNTVSNGRDNDSDGDGCADALEAAGGFSTTNTDGNDRLTGGVDPNGVPVVAAGGQATTTAVLDNVDSSACPALVLDNDNDGLEDAVDLDDDNDGILDTDEGCSQTVLTPTYVSTTSVVSPINTGLYLPAATANGLINQIGAAGTDGHVYDTTPAGVQNPTFTYTLTIPAEIQIATFELYNVVGGRVDEQLRSYNLQITDMATNNVVVDSDASTNVDLINGVPLTVPLNLYEGSYTIVLTDTDVPLDNREFSEVRFVGIECILDTDMDGILDYQDLDSDNDGIADVIEAGGTDADNDGRADDDDDNVNNTASNGIPTSAGAGLTPTETTMGTPDYLNLDSDGDGCSDANEAYVDLNADGADGGVYNPGNVAAEPLTVAGGTVNPDGTVIAAAYDTGAVAAVTDAGDTSGCMPPVVPDTDGDGITDDVDLDDDNDGILDTVEGTVDTDGDGVIDSLDLDSDNDGIPDILEAGSGADMDGDGQIDYPTPGDPMSMNDTNNDGLDDGIAASPLPDLDSDNDGLNDRLDLDSDNDGIADIIEAGGTDADGDGQVDYATPGDPTTMVDVDQDGFIDTIDTDDNTIAGVGDGGTALPDFDNDGDLLANRLDLDSDNDGIHDVIESGGTDTDSNGTADDDDDNVDNTGSNGIPTSAGGGNTPTDTGADGSPDYLNLDSDGDGCPDANEAYDSANADGGDGGQFGIGTPAAIGANGLVAAATYDTGVVATVTDATDTTACDVLDADGDGVIDTQEITDGTDPNDPCDFVIASISVEQAGDYITADCDGDGVPNGVELLDGTNPEDPCDFVPANVSVEPSGDYLISDCDGDGVTNGTEVGDGTDPTDPCSFNEPSVTLEQTDGYLTADCDGDTIPNGQEITDGTNPNDPCSSRGGVPPEGTTCDIIIDNELVGPQVGEGFFRIGNIEAFPNNTVRIYNRWGILVYETRGYDSANNNFRGFSEGRATIAEDKALPVGVYFYVIDFMNNGTNTTRSGYLYVNR